jgi:DNA-binding Lrp family transcriptional regulator
VTTAHCEHNSYDDFYALSFDESDLLKKLDSEECHRITGEDCFYLKVYLRSIDELSTLLDRFLAHGETTTSIVNASPIPRRDPPIDNAESLEPSE